MMGGRRNAIHGPNPVLPSTAGNGRAMLSDDVWVDPQVKNDLYRRINRLEMALLGSVEAIRQIEAAHNAHMVDDGDPA